MADGAIGLDEARARAFGMKLEDMNPGDPELFKANAFWPYFERLRNEEPVHWCRDSEFGPYWSVTRYNDIMAVDTSSARRSAPSSRRPT